MLAFALRGALDGGCLYRHLAVLAAAGMVGVGEFEQFDGRAVFNYERDADAVGWAVGRHQDFAASKLGGEISHFKRDVRNLPDEIRDRRVRFETHTLHAKFAFLMADDKEFQVFQVGLARLRFSSGNSDVMVPAHLFFALLRRGIGDENLVFRSHQKCHGACGAAYRVGVCFVFSFERAPNHYILDERAGPRLDDEIGGTWPKVKLIQVYGLSETGFLTGL